MEYRSNQHEFNYYGSDLNKFVDQYARRDMTAMNIDLILHRRINGTNHFKIIESKHTHESTGKGQLITLTALALLSKVINSLKIEYRLSVYIVKGDYPYDTCEVTNLTKNVTVELNRLELLDFLNFKSTY